MRPVFLVWGLVLIGSFCYHPGHAQLFRNSRPIILSQKPLTIESGKPITIQFTDLVVIDLDDPYPQGFTIIVYPGDDFEVSGTTVTPDADFEGNLRVPVAVSDGEDESRLFFLRITVTEPENVPPVITGQIALTMEENTSLTITVTHLQVTDPDNDFPDDFDVRVYGGNNYSVAGDRITPDANFTGVLNVGVRVNDGDDDSNLFTLTIEVIPENEPPVITGQSPLSVEENSSLSLSFNHLNVTDPDDNYPDGFQLKINPGSNYKVAGSTITPNENFTGTLNVDVRVNDGIDDSNVFTVKITVFPENIPPVITGQATLSIVENTSLTLAFSHLKVTDPDNKYPSGFSITVYQGANYEVSGTKITPAAGFTGTIQPEVTVSDGKDNSNRFKLSIRVTPANRAPVITGQQALAYKEDGSIILKLAHLTVNDPDNEYPTDFTLDVLPGNGYTVDGHTVSTPTNFNGTITVSVTVNDGELTSKPYPVSITVNPVNDAPEISQLEPGALSFMVGKAPAEITEKIEISDADKDNITLAEVAFDNTTYRAGIDILQYDKSETPAINGVFDQGQGVLFMIGNAPAAEYAKALRNVTYNFVVGEEEINLDSTKRVTIKVNDGLVDSKPASRDIKLIKSIMLDIPEWFTPNGDASNDTWRVQSLNSSDTYPDAIIRVFTIRGTVVYEAQGLQNEWDGRHKGDVLPTDTYYYTINLNLPYTNTTYRGMVTILR